MDVFHAGIATHYCNSSKISELEQKLLQSKYSQDIEGVINHFCSKLQSEYGLLTNIDEINDCFDASSVEEIIIKLQKDNSDWARRTLKVMPIVDSCL